MKISVALQLQKSIAEEIAHKRGLEKDKSWSYVSYTPETPNARHEPNFDFDGNHKLIKELSKLHSRLGRAISQTNLTMDVVGINDDDYADWC